MRRSGIWIALIAILLLVNVMWWMRQGGSLLETSASPDEPVGEAGIPVGEAGIDTVDTAPSATDTPVDQSAVDAAAEPDDPAISPSSAPGPAGGLLLPVQGIGIADIHDTFNQARGSERRHEALDIMAPAGTPILAVADGTIEKLFTSDAGGLTIYQFEPGGRFSYYYAHLQAYAPGIVEGQPVRRGDVLGTVGSSGNADPAAPHLHFAVFRLTPAREWWTGEPVNPYPLLRGARVPADTP